MVAARRGFTRVATRQHLLSVDLRMLFGGGESLESVFAALKVLVIVVSTGEQFESIPTGSVRGGFASVKW